MLKIELEVDTNGEVIGTKEAVVQLLEQLGEIKVVSCEAVEPEQISFTRR